jgi:hypothetical protein
MVPRVEIGLDGATVALRAPCGADELAAAGGSPIERAARLVAACAGGIDPDALTVGAFHRALMAIRSAGFGGAADAVADCPCCGARMDAPLDFDAMLAALPDKPPPARLDAAGARWRPLRLGDLRAAAVCGTGADDLARRALVEGPPPDDAALATVEAALLAADPAARLTVRGACPACGRDAALTVDPIAFALAPLSGPERLLDEIDAIARAYGWSEADILSLPTARRRAYLARIAAADAPGRRMTGAAA